MRQTQVPRHTVKSKYPLFSIIEAPYQALRRMHGDEEGTEEMIKACRDWGAAWGLVSDP